MFGHHSTSLLHNNHPPPEIKSASSSHSHNKFLLNSYKNPKITNSNNNNNEKIINTNNNNNIGDGIGDYVDEQQQSNPLQQHKRNNKYPSSSQAQWSFQVMPSLYSLYQKVYLTISLMNVFYLFILKFSRIFHSSTNICFFLHFSSHFRIFFVGIVKKGCGLAFECCF